MIKDIKILEDQNVGEKSKNFIKNINSDMHFKSEFSANGANFDWLNEVEFALIYLDNIVRSPRVILVNEEEVVKVERAKKITVASIKNLARNTHFIEKIDDVSKDVQPSKILEVRSEESYNTYENRFIFTLIDMLNRFIARQEESLKDLNNKNSKKLQYAASTVVNGERINVELNIDSKEITKLDNDKETQEKLKEIKERIKKIKQYLTYWNKSEFIKNLIKARASFVIPPIKKTNLILKNPNFQVATRLWEFLNAYGLNEQNDKQDGLDTNGTNTLKEMLDNSFLTQYFVLDSISASKREQKEKLSRYAVVMLEQQVQSAISLLLNCGVKITDEQILEMIAEEIKKEKTKKLVGKNDVKKKFMSVMDEYIENTQNYL